MIYVVTTLTEIDHAAIMSSKGKSLGYEKRTPGWFENYDQAEDSVKTNCGNIYDGRFDYVVIEAINQGMFAAAWSRPFTWFEWVPKLQQYMKIDQPAQWFNCGPFGMG